MTLLHVAVRWLARRVKLPEAHGRRLCRIPEHRRQIRLLQRWLTHEQRRARALDSQVILLQARERAVARLLRELSQWNGLDVASDGAAWRTKIEAMREAVRDVIGR